MRFPAVVLLVVAALGACGDDGRREVLVSAAASLTDAFAVIEAEFERQYPDVDIVLNFGGSSALREQILSGAPVDVFAPANQSTMDEVSGSGLVSGEDVAFATNRLTLATPAGNPAGVDGIADLSRRDLLIGLCSPAVPCGSLADAALARAGVPGSPDTREPDVRSLLTKISAGELDVGIVYVTDVAATRDVDALGIAAEYNPAATYPIAVLDRAAGRADAARFVEYVLSSRGQEILRSFGFGSP